MADIASAAVDRHCGTCLFYEPHKAVIAGQPLPPGVILRGRCRRYPAATATNAEDWCGEHATNGEAA